MCISRYFRSFVVFFGVILVLIKNLVRIKDAYPKNILKRITLIVILDISVYRPTLGKQ